MKIGSTVQPTSDFRLLSFLLLFIFGGAIVGETAALSMLVSVKGTAVLGRLYLLNGILLLGLPLLFFRNIDRVSRARLLGVLLPALSVILLCYFVMLLAGFQSVGLVTVAYPVAYLSKTTLFLTFWTLANDLCTPSEAKRVFPSVAAWGFVGGIVGSLAALVLVRTVKTTLLVGLWAGLYLGAYGILLKMEKVYGDRLLQTERVLPVREPLHILARDVLSIDLVRSIGLLYFLVFLSIFSLDFLFWKYCHAWFPGSDSLASFQFSFYLVYAVATVAGLWLVMPRLINRWGFTRIFFIFPIVLVVGSAGLLVLIGFGVAPRLLFATLIFVQFLRYVVFENAFSPIYQMFFFAIPEQKRGRAKMFLDGVVKPAAIFTAGLLIMVLGTRHALVLIIVCVCSATMGFVVFAARKRYMSELFPRFAESVTTVELVNQIGLKKDSRIVSLIGDYLVSSDSDLRSLAVRILAQNGSREAFLRLKEVYITEEQAVVRETIARSLSNFYWYEAREFIERLLEDPNPRVRANVVFSLNQMNCHWKWQLREKIKSLLFENSLRLQVESACYLWLSGDASERSNVKAFYLHLIKAPGSNKRSAGLYLVGRFQPDGWENLLISHLDSSSIQVYTKSIETLLGGAALETRLTALQVVESLERDRIAIAGRCLEQMGPEGVRTLEAWLPAVRNRRMMFECVHALRRARGMSSDTVQVTGPQIKELVSRWIFRELSGVYRDVYVWVGFSRALSGVSARTSEALLEHALSERLMRVAEWALDAMALLDNDGLVSWGRKELNLSDERQRSDMVEILESLGNHWIGGLVAPILKNESWEQLARVGRSQFRSHERKTDNSLEHFALSENRWVSLCGLYCLYQACGPLEMRKKWDSLLEKCSIDKYRYLQTAALELRNSNSQQGDSSVESFNLLETVLFLKRTPLFANVAGERLMELAEICILKRFEAGTILSREGDVSDHLYIVKTGQIRIVKKGPAGDTVISEIESGDSYGELGLFHQSPRSASAVAAADCELYLVQRSALKKLLMSVPEIAYNFLEIFAAKLLRTTDVAVASNLVAIGSETQGGQDRGEKES